MMKRLCVPLACLAVLLVADRSSARTHGVDDSSTLTLLHLEERVDGGPFEGTAVTWKKENDDDSNFPRPNANDGLFGTRAGWGNVFQPALDSSTVAPVTVGTSNYSFLFDDGSADGSADGIEVAPNIGVPGDQVNETGIWTNVWGGYGSFETQFWFRNDDLNPQFLDQDEGLIGAASRWEVYAAGEDKAFCGAGFNTACADGTLTMTLWMDAADGGGNIFLTNEGNYVVGDGNFNHVKAGYDENTGLPFLDVNGVPATNFFYTFNGNSADPGRRIRLDPTELGLAAAFKGRGLSGWMDEVQVWTNGVPEPGSVSLLVMGLGLAALRRRRA